ncbi:MAG: hypothetical protein ABI345_07175 [Jatrophihabitans sp.]
MTTENEIDLKAGRRRVARSRGALSGVLLIVLGLVAALLPFVGPYFNFGYTPAPGQAWHWTAGRFWYEVLPGAGAVLGGLILLLSASRALTLFGAWLAAVSGAWLVTGPTLQRVLKLDAGSPDPQLRPGLSALAVLLYFCATGAVILLVAGIALGRLSVHSVRDVRSAERRAEAERLAEEQRIEDERRAVAERAEADRVAAERAQTERAEADRVAAERAQTERAEAERAQTDQVHGGPQGQPDPRNEHPIRDQSPAPQQNQPSYPPAPQQNQPTYPPAPQQNQPTYPVTPPPPPPES